MLNSETNTNEFGQVVPPWYQQEIEEQNAAHFGLEEIHMHCKYPFAGTHPMAGVDEQ